jgi:hypothetical protein
MSVVDDIYYSSILPDFQIHILVTGLEVCFDTLEEILFNLGYILACP